MKNQTLFNDGWGGELENFNSKSLSRKFLFSLAAVSVLATCANATISGGGCSNGSCNINDGKTDKITVSGTDNTLIIEVNGSVNVNNSEAINFESSSSTTTFKNQGTITSGSQNAVIKIGENGNSGATITTFENSGIIGNGSSKTGISVLGSNNSKSTITNFTNSGTISSKEAAIYLANTNINTFTNSGLINSNSGTGINLSNSTISNFTNSGTIKTTGTAEPNPTTASLYASSGINLQQATIENFTNKGVISGKIGINLSASSIKTLTNQGTIESTSSANELAGAISITSLYSTSSTIEKLTNEGVIKSNNAHGIFIGDSNTIKTLENKGTIEAGLNGITFYGFHTNKQPIDIGKIILEKGSVIKAGNNGINIDGSDYGIKGEGIEVKGRLEGGNAGIYIGGGKQVNTSIKVSGTIQGGNGGIINTGTIGQEGQKNQEYGITIEENGLITSTNGSGILNTENGIIYGNITNNSDNDLSLKNDSDATITSGIINNGNGTIHINNQGSIGKNEDGHNIANNGNGGIVVEDWVVSTGDDGKLEGIVVGGSQTGNVIIDNVTIDQGGLDLGELEDISNIVSGVRPDQVGNIGINGSGEISLNFDPITGKLSTNFNLNASIAGATFRSLINTTSRRASFIDSVMGNSMQHFANTSIAMQEKGNLYANASDYIKNDFNNGSYGYNKEHSLFILPYTSSQNVKLSLNEESKGHTRGTIIGYSTLKDSGIYGVYVGYEDTKMSSTYFDINNRSYYTGLKYFNTLFTTSKGQEVYLRAQGKTAFIKNKLSKKIGKSAAEASPNSYAYGMSGDLGMNFNHGDNIFSPEAGLVYEGGYTEAFSMINTKGQATVIGGERTYANYLNLLSTRTSFTWFRDWLPNLKTSMTLGAKFNINPQVKAKARFGQVKVEDEFYLPRVQRYVTTSMIVPLNNVFYFSLNYNGIFDSKGDTHTGFAQFNYIW